MRKRAKNLNEGMGFTPMRNRIVGIAIVGLLVLVLTSSGYARDPYPKNTHNFAPTVDNSGLIVSYGSEYLGMLGLAYGIYVDEAIAPLYWRPADSVRVGSSESADTKTLIDHQAGMNINFAFGITDYLNIGLAFPMIVYRGFDEEFTDQMVIDERGSEQDVQFDLEYGTGTFALEDLRLDVKVMGLHRTRRCLGIALVTGLTIPIYEPENFASDQGVTVAPRLVLDYGRNIFTVVFNIGYKYYSKTPSNDSTIEEAGLSDETIDGVYNTDYYEDALEENQNELLDDIFIGDELLMNLGIKIRFKNNQELILDSAVKTLVKDPFGSAYTNSNYAEVMLAYRKYWVRMHYNALTLGASLGVTALSQDTPSPGTPLARFFIGFGRDEQRLHYMVTGNDWE